MFFIVDLAISKDFQNLVLELISLLIVTNIFEKTHVECIGSP